MTANPANPASPANPGKPADPAEDAGFTAAFSVDQTPDEVFRAINNVRGWWSEDIEGDSGKVGGEFIYRYRDAHRCRIKVTELAAGDKVVWRVLDNYFDFTRDKEEWKDTEIRFEIVAKDGETTIRFAHVGLVPAYECFDVCSNSWGFYLYSSLRALIRTGQGLPNRKEQALSP
jgi:Activator of Hsp90 ATPase homolog 1-like protein